MTSGYHSDVQLSMEEAGSRIRATQQDRGFVGLTEIDVQAALEKKLDVDFRSYKILGTCHPPSALKALSIVPEIGLLLPCNVTVSQNDDGTVHIAAVDAEAILGVVKKAELTPDYAPYYFYHARQPAGRRHPYTHTST